MPNSTNRHTDQQVPFRTRFIYSLASRFTKDLDKAIYGMQALQALEVVEHLVKSVDILEEYIQTEDENEQNAIYGKYAALEDALVKKWGKLLSSYRNQKFHEYFDRRTVLAEKEIVSTEEYNNLEHQELSSAEMGSAIYAIRRSLGATRDFLLGKQAPSDETIALLSKDKANEGLGDFQSGFGSDNVAASQAENEGDDQATSGLVTKAKGRLALYFLVKAAGGDPRGGSDVAAITRLAHLITGERLTSLPNSNAYKFFLKAPDFKSPKGKLKDLQSIRPYFEQLALTSALALIDEEIQRTQAGE